MTPTIYTKGSETRGVVIDAAFRFKCARCGLIFAREEGSIGTGYAVRPDDSLICYKCCGETDAEELRGMRPGDRTVHYWDGREVTNWPGTLRIKPYHRSTGRHNIGRTREDVWFMFDGKPFHGVNIGDNQILRIRAIKAK